MKKTLLITLALIPTISFAANIKLVNDTSRSMSIHTGSGVVKMNKGGSTSFTCKPGKKVHTAKSGMKKNFIFKIESKHCGKTVKLSSVI